MNRRAIVDAAAADARLFADEFPGQSLSGDWDAEAWAVTAQRLGLGDDEPEEAWALYRDTLHSQVEMWRGKP